MKLSGKEQIFLLFPCILTRKKKDYGTDMISFNFHSTDHAYYFELFFNHKQEVVFNIFNEDRAEEENHLLPTIFINVSDAKCLVKILNTYIKNAEH